MEKINKLKKILKREQIDGYLVPKNDEFFEEYVPEYREELKYISNFSGSFGFALILRDKNYLFVDGRYTLQAADQSGKNFRIITFSKKKKGRINKYKKKLVGYDPKLFTRKSLRYFFGEENYSFKP